MAGPAVNFSSGSDEARMLVSAMPWDLYLPEGAERGNWRMTDVFSSAAVREYGVICAEIPEGGWRSETGMVW